jgi:hypothetical protein
MPLPWIVGAGVKLYLDVQRRPTLPWGYFLSFRYLPELLAATTRWAVPYFFLALFSLTVVPSPFSGWSPAGGG